MPAPLSRSNTRLVVGTTRDGSAVQLAWLSGPPTPQM